MTEHFSWEYNSAHFPGIYSLYGNEYIRIKMNQVSTPGFRSELTGSLYHLHVESATIHHQRIRWGFVHSEAPRRWLPDSRQKLKGLASAFELFNTLYYPPDNTQKDLVTPQRIRVRVWVTK